jgi:thioredoxin 1
MNNHRRVLSILLIVLLSAAAMLLATSCSGDKSSPERPDTERKIVTFIELGSVNCLPCKAMQPVMEKVEAELGDQVEVVFYDVWTAEGQPFGREYGIRLIPTQIFLDADGKEYFRHEGFFPEEELYKVLEQGGVKL